MRIEVKCQWCYNLIMEILVANQISKSFVLQEVLADISFSIEKGDKVGIMGVNGAGKSTLFKIITGELTPDTGTLYKAANTRLAYMAQHTEYDSTATAMEDALMVFSRLLDMETRLQDMQAKIEQNQDMQTIHKFTELNDRYLQEGGMTFKARTKSMLLGLGLTENELGLPLSALSGGQRTRVMLAKLLLSEPDILLLDEPTNHLDLSAIEWLENFLVDYKGTVLVISHDRFFLDAFVNKIFEIEYAKLTAYQGNYSDFVRQKQENQLVMEREFKKKSRELKRIEAIIEEQKRWNTQRSLITARHKQKMADKIASEIVRPNKAQHKIKVRLDASKRSGNEVLDIENLAMGFDDHTLFSNVNIDIRRTDKAFLLGRNGIGKTTLFRILLGEIPPTRGGFSYGANVEVGYYSQTQDNLPLDMTMLEAVYSQVDETSVGKVRDVLALFLFTGDDIEKRIETLSGGERARVSLAILLLSKCNFILLDEPTNHLDIPSREVLEHALLSYDGTLFVISHDRYFIKKLATKIYDLQENGAALYNGDYAYYLDERIKRQENAEHKEAAEIQDEKPPASDYWDEKKRASEQRQLLGRIKRAEENIAKTEEEISVLEERLSAKEVVAEYEMVLSLSQEIATKTEVLNRYYEEWQELSDLAEQ